ncbi:hypothetical protein FACS189459_0830 [Bacilli bacterium]|nr:hypothetical protein FACS189459_0830 [Bacilli bacterium]
MRNKSNAIDYRYFCEPNIVNIDISDLIKQTLSNELVTHIKIKEQLICYGVNENIIKLLLDNYELYKIYKYVNDKINNISLTTT